MMLIVLCLAPLPGQEKQTSSASAITWQSLLREASDLTTLTRWPAHPFTTHQISSYDRASVTAEQPDDWFANHDRGHCLYEGSVDQETPYFAASPLQGARVAGTIPAGTRLGIARHKRNIPGYIWVYSTEQPVQYAGYIAAAGWKPHPQGPVLADLSGPGCLTRIWSSNPGEGGKVRIYLDNQATPILEARLLELLNGTWEVQAGGKRVRPIPAPYASEKARGYELLFPIPYRERCLVVVERPHLQYQIQYRRYAKETPVQSLDVSELIESQATLLQQAQALTTTSSPPLETTARQLANLKPDDKPDLQRTSLGEPRLEPQQSRELILLEAPGNNPNRAIVQIEASVQADRLMEALRSVLLQITFDGEKSPQVNAPLGDFFGTAPGANPLSVLTSRVTANGKLTSHWIMPYARHARIVLKNLDTQPVTVQLVITHAGYVWTEQSLHFHANWRTGSLNTRPYQDWLVHQSSGRGFLAGTHLSIHNPVKEWWGEGDSKIWIDGERFPSHWGTGTDDDFGLGWADRTVFSHLWRAQPRHDGKGHEGFTSLYRARLLDRIAFTKSAKFELEARHDLPSVHVQYAATTYWYALPGATCETQELSADILRGSLPGGQP